MMRRTQNQQRPTNYPDTSKWLKILKWGSGQQWKPTDINIGVIPWWR